MPRQPFNCRSCGQPFAWQPGAGIHCGPECEADYAMATACAELALTAEGFSRSEDAPNLWLKDGVAVSIEQVIHEGFEESMAAHSRALVALGS